MTRKIDLIENTIFVKGFCEVAKELIAFVDDNMMSAFGEPVATVPCCVDYKEGDPCCCKKNDGNHIIYLSVTDFYWCQLIYQFAHEYCHHLINGSLSGVWHKVLWFEETICEVSSLYNLYRFENYCENHENKGWKCYSSSVHDYLGKRLTKCGLFDFNENGGWYDNCSDALEAKDYKRDLYKEIAIFMYPYFIGNPRLWKMILNIEDIRKWDSFESLLEHLQSKADESYDNSLRKMFQMFK